MKSFSDTEQFQRDLPPTNYPILNAHSLCRTSDGKGILSVSWTYTQGINIATHFAVYVKYGGGTILNSDLHFDVDATKNAAQFSLPMQLSIGARYTVGVAAFAVCRSDAIFNSTTTQAHGEVLDQYQTEIMMEPEFVSCFISYSHEDKPFACRLEDSLQKRGIRCWRDEKKMVPGDDIYDQVDRGIRESDKVLLCCSESSLTSWWVDNEIGTAFEKEQQINWKGGEKVLALIPLNLDGYLFSDKWNSGYCAQIRRRLAADFTGWDSDNKKFEEQFERVLLALRTQKPAELQAPASRL